MKERNEKKLSQAIIEAAVRLESAPVERLGPGGWADGSILMFIGNPAPAEWMVVRRHPDDPGIVNLVPCTDFPLRGPGDVDAGHRPLTARCGMSVWVATHLLDSCGVWGEQAPPQFLAEVRAVLHFLAVGKYTTSSERAAVADDPEYWAHREELTEGVEWLEKEHDPNF